MIRNQKQYRPNHRDQKAIDIQASHSRSSESVENEAAYYGADDA